MCFPQVLLERYFPPQLEEVFEENNLVLRLLRFRRLDCINTTAQSRLEFGPLLSVGTKVFSNGRPPGPCRIGHRHLSRLMRLEEGMNLAHRQGIRSLGSFQGNMLTSAFGASMANSMATAYGCAGTSSGRTRNGFGNYPRNRVS
jgi:hypothetical protein